MTSVTNSLSAASLLLKADPAKAKAATQVSTNLQQALSTAKQSVNNAASQRKALAAQQIALIKQELKSLQMMAADPKTLARMAKELAQQLAKALKDYAAAGATASEVASQQTGASIPTTPDAPNDQNAAPATTDPSAPTQDQAAPKQTQAYAKAQTTSALGDDGDFINDAHHLVDDLRFFVKMQKSRLHGTHDKHADKDIHDAEDALDEASTSLQKITFNSVTA